MSENIHQLDCETEIIESLDSDVSELMKLGVTQKVSRMNIDGGETVVGIFRCDFEPEQDRYVLNIPIHPPLQFPPNVETVAFANDVRTRVTNCEKFGVRLELIANPSANEPRTIFVETIITANRTNQ